MGLFSFLFGKKGQDPRQAGRDAMAKLPGIEKRGMVGFGAIQDMLSQQLSETDAGEAKAMALLGDQARIARMGVSQSFAQAGADLTQQMASGGMGGTSAAAQMQMGLAGQAGREQAALGAQFAGQQAAIGSQFAERRSAVQGAQLGALSDERAFREKIGMERMHLLATNTPMGVQAGYYGGQKGNLGGLVSAATGIAKLCWVAREVYGANDPKWLVFREWVALFSPKWFAWLYLQYGEVFARWISNKPRLKRVIRRWMDGRIKTVLEAGRLSGGKAWL